MRADQLVMAAVVGLGGFALFRMLTNKSAGSPSTDPNMVPSGEPGSETAQSPGTLTPGLAYLGDPLNLQWGGWYRGRINTQNALPPFGPDASKDLITQALTALGLSKVQVFMSPSELPAGWPAGEIRNDGTTRYFAARWGQPNLAVPRPSALEAMWKSTAANNAVVSGLFGGFDGVEIEPVTVDRIYG